MPAANPEQSIFLAALDLPTPAERAAYVKGACGADPALLANVRELLAAHENGDDFLDRPPPGATVDEQPVTERPGTLIGPYKLKERIGEGGMGLVFVAEQHEPVRRKVALKIIKPGMDSAQVIARFEAERQALAMMDHINIAKVFDAGTTETGRPFFVMELVHGVPITEYCDANKLTPRQRLELFVPVCQAIQHAHQKGIIHRDIKPSNILVTMYDDKPVPKVIDFGVAKAIDQRLTEKSVYTQFGTLVGTFEYMSPEQAEMNAFGVDTRSDIYSLGVLLYELLTGTTPLERQRLREAAFDEIRRIIREEEPQRPSVRLSTSGTLAKVAAARKTEPAKLSRLMRGELDWVVMRCLEKDRSRRYDTASALARDVERHLKDEPVEARPPSAWYRLRKAARRNRTALTVAGVVAAALVLGTAATIWQASLARADRERAELAEAKRIEEQAIAEAALKKQAEELAALVRRQALDEAIAAAMSGELDKAKKAIHDAELKGVSLGQVHWLQGLVHYQRSENELALEEFEQARKLMPESVAPLAMILRCVGPTSTKFPQVYQDMLRLTPTTPEDYLCRGFAAGLVEQKQPIDDLDKAIELRDSPIARTFRAAALTRIAADMGNLPMLERAQEDLKRAKILLPGNSFVQRISLYMKLHAANLYAQAGQTENRRRALEEAKGYADALKNSPLAAYVMLRVYYFHQIGDDVAALNLLRQAADQEGSRELSYQYAQALYRQGSIGEALKVLDRRKQQDHDANDNLRIFLTAEQSEEGHQQAYDSLLKLAARRQRESGQPIAYWSAPAALLFLGKRREAAEFARGNASLPAGARLPDFLAGKVSEQAYLEEVRGSRYWSCIHQYWVGMARLSEGDRKGARDAFKAVVDTGLYTMFSHTQSRIMLERLERDTAWPRWIKAKDGAKAPARPLLPELAKAIRGGDLKAVRARLDGGVDVNARDANGNTPLLLAAAYAGPDCVELLLKKGADVHAANKLGATTLIRAATDYEKVKLLIDAGADVKMKTASGKTPLTLAARKYGNSKTVKLLLDQGADARERNALGFNPIQVAAASGDLDAVKLLVEAGADVNDFTAVSAAGAFGVRTPLGWAAYRNDVPMIRYLLEHKADPNKATPLGTPLTFAAWQNSVQAAEVLLAHGARTAVKSGDGSTPLHWAAGSDSPDPELVKLLLKHGADPNAEFGEQIDKFLGVAQTPRLIAEKRGQTALVEALAASGAKASPKVAAAKRPVKPIPEKPDAQRIRDSAEAALRLLQESAIVSSASALRHASRQRTCVTCHQHFLPLAAMGQAKDRAVRLDRDAVTRLGDQVAVGFGGTVDIAEVDLGIDPATSIGYRSFGLIADHRPANATTDLWVHHLVVIQAADGRWPAFVPRPPMQASDVSSTALAIQAIKHYGWAGRKAEFDRAVDRGRKWLWTVKAETTEDAAYQLLGLHWAGELGEKLAGLARALLSQQRKDGGWAQLPKLESDAYATGQALYALSRAVKHPTTNRDWQQGLRFLVGTQYDDGSWHVVSRAYPFQPTMDSGFPHGRDSWISAAGTSWAVLAMTEALPPGTTTEKPPTVVKRPKDAPPVAAEKVDFAKQIKPLLERSCVACHGPDKQRSKFRVDSRDALLTGGNSGSAAVVPEKSAQSPLMDYLSGRVEGMEMPPLPKRNQFAALTKDEVELFRAWIEQGAVWPKDVVLGPSKSENPR